MLNLLNSAEVQHRNRMIRQYHYADAGEDQEETVVLLLTEDSCAVPWKISSRRVRPRRTRFTIN
jgi:hypothetical protein